MALTGSAVLAIWNGIQPEAEEGFISWHINEHIPERVAITGFLRGRRYISLQGTPKYFNFYETENIGVLSSPGYLEKLNSPSPWSKIIISNFTDTSRTACNTRLSFGQGDGATIMTLRLSLPLTTYRVIEEIRRIAIDILSCTGVTGFHLLQGDEETSNQPTEEKKLREKNDELAQWVILIESATPQALQSLISVQNLPEKLIKCGASSDMKIGIYTEQFSLSNSQIKSERITSKEDI
ncbi:TPA: hypothetical protein ACTW5M_004581 [Raoultella planticola]|nr:hypothetical protein [Klebsiella pneumoniae]